MRSAARASDRDAHRTQSLKALVDEDSSEISEEGMRALRESCADNERSSASAGSVCGTMRDAVRLMALCDWLGRRLCGRNIFLSMPIEDQECGIRAH